MQEFENKIIHAARTGKRSELVQLQKLFETEILLSMLKSLNNASSDSQPVIENLVLQDDNTGSVSKIREKRALGLLTNLLGSSSGSSSGGGGGGGGDSAVRHS